MAQIKIRRGTDAQLSGITLALAELGFTTDTKKLYIGDGVSNILVNPDQPEFITESVTKTVGASQDFTTLNDAFEWLEGIDALGYDSSDPNPWYPNNGPNNITVTLSLIAGTFDSTGSTGGGWRLKNKNYNLTIVGVTSATTTISSCEFTFEDMGDISFDNLTLSSCYYKSIRCSTFLGLSIEWTSVKSEDFVATGTKFHTNGSLNFQGTGIYTDCELASYDGAELFLYGSENASSRGAWSFNSIIGGSDCYMYIDPYYSGHGDLTVGRVLSYGGKIDLGPDQSFGTTGKLIIEKVGTRDASYVVAQGGGKIHLWATEIEVKHAYNYTVYPNMTGAFVAVDGSQIVFRSDKVTDITVTTLADATTPCFNTNNLGSIVYDESTVTFNAPSGVQNNTPAGQIQTDGSVIYDGTTVPTTEDTITDNITKTVGVGQDFTTLEDAFDYIMELNSKMAIDDDTEDYGKNKPSVTLDLTAATHTVTGHNSSNFCTLRNIDFTVYIFGATSATSLIRGSGKYLTFIDCKGVFFDNLDIGVGLKVVGTRIGGGSTFDSTAFKSDDLIFTQYQQFEFSGGAEAYFTGDVLAVDKIWNYYCNITFYPNSGSLTGDWNVTRMFIYGGVVDFEPWNNDLYISGIYSAQNSSVFVGVGNELFVESVNGFTTDIRLLAASGSTLEVTTWADDINFNGSGANDSCEAHTEGKLSLKANNGSNNIVFNGIGSGQYGFSSATGGSINITANAITNNTIETINEHPYGQIQTDGSVIYDGTTVPTPNENWISEDVTKTVGSTSADFATINEAFRWIENKYPTGTWQRTATQYNNLPRVTLVLQEETHVVSPDVTAGYYTRLANARCRVFISGESVAKRDTTIIDLETNNTSLQFLQCPWIHIHTLTIDGYLDVEWCGNFQLGVEQANANSDTVKWIASGDGGAYFTSIDNMSIYLDHTSVPKGKMYFYSCRCWINHDDGVSVINAPDWSINPRARSYIYISSPMTIKEVVAADGGQLQLRIYGTGSGGTFTADDIQAHDGSIITSRVYNNPVVAGRILARSGSTISLAVGTVTLESTGTMTEGRMYAVEGSKITLEDAVTITPTAGYNAIECGDDSQIFVESPTITMPSTEKAFSANSGGVIKVGGTPTITATNPSNIEIGKFHEDGTAIFDGSTIPEINAESGITNEGSDLALIEGMLAIPKGYDGGPGFEFRFDTSQTAYIYDAQPSLTITVNDGTDPGGSNIANLFRYQNGYFNLDTYKDINDDFEFEVTGFSLRNSSNTSWMPYILFHSGGTSVTTIKVWFLEGDGTTWTEVYNGPSANFIAPMTYTVFTTGLLKGVRYRFEDITGNAYIKMVGATSRTSDSFAWQMLKGGGSFYGDVDGKSLGVQTWEIQQDGDATFNSVVTDTISEETAANGVDIDGLKVKDGDLVSTVDIGALLGDAAGSYAFSVRTNADDSVFDVYSDGQMTITNTVSIDATLDFTFGSGGIYLDTGTPIEARAGQDITMKLGDAIGANKFSVTDSADVEQFSVDSDGKITLGYPTNTFTFPNSSTLDETDWFSYDYIALHSSNSESLYFRSAWNVECRLGDAAGGRKFIVEDSSGVDQFSVDSDGNVVLNGSIYLDNGRSIVEDTGAAGDAAFSLSDGNVFNYLGDAAGVTYFGVVDSGINDVFTVDSDGNVTAKGNLSLFTGNGDILMDNNNQIILQNSTDRLAIKLGDDAGFSTFEILNSSAATIFWVDALGDASFDGNVAVEGTKIEGKNNLGLSVNSLYDNLTLTTATDYDIVAKLGDAIGANKFSITDSADVEQVYIDSNGVFGTPGNMNIHSGGTTYIQLGDAAGGEGLFIDDSNSSTVFELYSDGQTWFHNTINTYNDITIKLGDAIGANKFSITDSADVEQFSVDSDGDVYIKGNIWEYPGVTNVDANIGLSNGDIYLQPASSGDATYIIDQTDGFTMMHMAGDYWQFGSDREITGEGSIAQFAGDISVNLGDSLGVNKFAVKDWAGVEKFSVDSDGNTSISGNLYIPHLARIYESPGGVGDASIQFASGSIFNYLGDNAGGEVFEVMDSDENTVASIDSDGAMELAGKLTQSYSNLVLDVSDVDDTPVDAATTAPISSNWAYDHENDTNLHGGGGSSVTISDTAPGSPTAGDLWFDSAAGIMSMYYNDGNTTQWVSLSSGSWGSFPLHDTPSDGATTDAITSNWAYDHENAADPHTGYVLESNVDDTPVDSATTDPISSNWAYDHENSTEVHMSISTAITTDPNDLTAGLVLCSHTNTPSGDANYWYIQTWQYLATSNRSQIATRYNPGGVSPELWIRHFYTSGWEDWVQMQDAAFAIQKDADTGSASLPAGTTAQRTASPSAGDIRFNTTDTGFEGWNGTSWGSIGGGATGAAGSGDKVFWENDTNVTTSYTITSGQNAMSAGPITIDDGVTVTVPDGSVWTIV